LKSKGRRRVPQYCNKYSLHKMHFSPWTTRNPANPSCKHCTAVKQLLRLIKTKIFESFTTAPIYLTYSLLQNLECFIHGHQKRTTIHPPAKYVPLEAPHTVRKTMGLQNLNRELGCNQKGTYPAPHTRSMAQLRWQGSRIP